MLNAQISLNQDELETILLGTAIDCPEVIGSIYLEKNLKPEMFTKKQNQMLFKILLDMYMQGITPDILSLSQYISSNNLSNDFFNISTFVDLQEYSSRANVEFYIEHFLAAYLRQEIKKVLSQTLSQIDSTTINPLEEISKIADKLASLSNLSNDIKVLSMQDLWALLKKTTEETRAKLEAGQKATGILSGFCVLDNATDGFQNGELSIIGARPSIGKTSFALSACMNIAKDYPVAFISLETPDKAIAIKTASLITTVSTKRLKKAFISESEKAELFGASGKEKFDKRNFYLVDKPRIHINELKTIVRNLVLVQKVKIVFIDYIGLIDAGTSEQPVFEKQSIVSRQLKSLAREFEIPIVALCQVSRENEKEKNKMPTLANLRGSGSIEQDADVVMFLHGERYTPKEDATVERELIIAKNRNGECLRGKILFRKANQRYENTIEDLQQQKAEEEKQSFRQSEIQMQEQREQEQTEQTTPSVSKKEFAPKNWQPIDIF
ncbi:replicative DNA helicase [Treponema pectinovorum]|uniref:replicative DNA helicase n=1 Tax=Treponema pectinovorum TaxID=164 RepID=UPI0011CC0118|nr:DnaB-like helicase C-terminal domain-containing protein [Treponema pectinovorum]